MRALANFINDARFQLFLGVIMLVSASAEIMQDLQSANQAVMGAHHGLFIYALAHILKSLPGLFDSVDRIQQARQGKPKS